MPSRFTLINQKLHGLAVPGLTGRH